jgi:hypothetical protein
MNQRTVTVLAEWSCSDDFIRSIEVLELLPNGISVRDTSSLP